MSFTSNSVDMTGACHTCCDEAACCDCEGHTLSFTTSGITEGSGGSCFCDSSFNRTWTLGDDSELNEGICVGWFVTYAVTETCAGQTTVTATASCVGTLLTVLIFAGVDQVAQYSGLMHCDGPSVLTWDSTVPDPTGAACTTWPATITVTYT